jgi:uncharacterized hydantoinase/oxoprolinase family protein
MAMVCGKEIEEQKEKLSWPELTDMAEQMADRELEFDADTVKKNLSRQGLKGVGTVGRPSSNKS